MNAFIKELSEKLNINFVASETLIGFGGLYFCNEKGEVEKIKLDQTNIQSLDDLLPIASSLKTLEICEADFIKNIEPIKYFTQLEELDLCLDITSLKGLEHLKNLKKMTLLCSDLTSLKEVFSIDSLSELVLVYPDCDSNLLLGLENLTNLETLSLWGIISLNKIPKNENLKNLQLCNNSISEIIEMEKWPNLEVLNLYCNPITKIQGLSTLKKLKELNLHTTPITKIEGLDELINLESLSLSHNSIAQIEGLDALENLKVLNLDNYLGESNTPITEIQGVNHLNKLETLILTGQRIVELKNLPTENLRKLEVSWNKIEYIDYNWLNSLKQNCIINLTGNPIQINYDAVPTHVKIVTNKKQGCCQ